MTTSDNGIAMGQDFEGFNPIPNNDPDGNSQVGYGCFLHSGPVDFEHNAIDRHYRDNPISREEADQLYRQHIKGICEPKLNRLMATCTLTRNQFDALSDFIFNEGDFTNDTLDNKFKNNGLIKCFREGRLNDVPEQIMRWVYGDGRVLPGLVRRRKAEVQMWQFGKWIKTQGASNGA